MPTIVTKSIGSAGGRDYATLADWIADCPADLVSADQVWRGEMYNDSEFLYTGFGNTALFISSITTDATRYIDLTAAAGESFQDDANVRTNPLRYDTSTGVGIRMTGALSTFVLANSYFHCSRLQVYMAGTSGAATAASIGAVNQVYRDLVCEFDDGSQFAFAQHGGLAVNVTLLLHDMDPIPAAFTNSGTSTSMVWVGCLALLASDSGGVASSVGFQDASSGGDGTCISCASFGLASPSAGNITSSSKNNATDAASWGAGSSNQTSVTFSQVTPFVDAAMATFDARAIGGTALAAHGFLDSTNAPNDISGLARPANPTIGEWQLSSALSGYRSMSAFWMGGAANSTSTPSGYRSLAAFWMGGGAMVPTSTGRLSRLTLLGAG